MKSCCKRIGDRAERLIFAGQEGLIWEISAAIAM
jgi:hypothetical protein